MYQALYRKYRPQTFDDVVGQENVTRTLRNQVIQNRLSHAYLFTGTRGTGKTTCAKILAKVVNCEHPQDGNPCNCCAACRSIDSGACVDVLEIDAASNNGVENVRALRDDAVFSPAEVKRRVYIIDEVHMLTSNAFNALLKIIEEPPAHLMFILATTELQKVPATILSRCQRYAFRRILPEDIRDRLQYIAYREQIDLEPTAAMYLARLADGGLRDAVSLLDQCASVASGTVTAETVCSTIGIVGALKTAEMLRAIARQDTARVLQLFHEEYAEGKDLLSILDEISTAARDLLVQRTAPKGGAGMISTLCTPEELGELTPLFSSGELLRIIRVLRETASNVRSGANRRVDAELCLISLCTPEAELDAQSLNARLSRLEARQDTAAGLSDRLSRLEARVARGTVVQAAPAAGEAPDLPEEEAPPWDDADAPPPGEFEENPPPREENTAAGFWPELVKRARVLLKPPVQGMFATGENAPLRGMLRGNILELVSTGEFVTKYVDRPEVLQAVSQAATSILGKPVTAKMAQNGRNGQEGFDQLLQFGSRHTDIVEIK